MSASTSFKYTRTPIKKTTKFFLNNSSNLSLDSFPVGLKGILRDTCHDYSSGSSKGIVTSKSADIQLEISPHSEDLQLETGREFNCVSYIWTIASDEYNSCVLEAVLYCYNGNYFISFNTSDSPAEFEFHTPLMNFLTLDVSFFIKNLIECSGWSQNQIEFITKDVLSIQEIVKSAVVR